MPRKVSRLAIVTAASLTALSEAASLFAEDPIPPVGTSQSGDAGSATRSVPIEDYRALKQEVDALKKHVESQDKRLAATTQPTAVNATTSQNGTSSGFFSNNNIDQRVSTLFAPRTENEYFSPFDIMNPAHIRADMPLQIGGFHDLSLYMGLETVGRYQAIRQENVFIKGAPGC